MADDFSMNPIISFSRGGQKIALGRFPSEDIILLHGSTGLGMPPVQIATSDRIGGDGSSVRGVRYTSREVFIPFAVWKRTKGELTDFRRHLYQALAPHLGMVTVSVEDPATGTTRFIEGYLKDGLEGNFGDDFRGSYQSFGLTFTCPDPWWKGEEKQILLRINPGSKPFISASVPFFPVVLSQSSAQGWFNVWVAGDIPVSPRWEFVGPGTDPKLSAAGSTFTINRTLKAGEKITLDMDTGVMSPDRWESVPLSSKLFKLYPGKNIISASMVDATVGSMIRGTYRERFMEAI